MALFGNIGEFVEARENWSQYVERLEQFFIANDITDAKKKSIFLSFIGPAAFHTLGNLVSPQKPSEESYDRLVELMSSFYNPKPLVTVQRFRFYSRFRQPNESVSTFVAELRSLAKDCQFGDSLQENLRDRLICGIADQTIQKRLLSEQNLSFKKAFDIAQSHESAERNIVTLQGSTSHSLEIHKVTSPVYLIPHVIAVDKVIIIMTLADLNHPPVTIAVNLDIYKLFVVLVDRFLLVILQIVRSSIRHLVHRIVRLIRIHRVILVTRFVHRTLGLHMLNRLLETMMNLTILKSILYSIYHQALVLLWLLPY